MAYSADWTIAQLTKLQRKRPDLVAKALDKLLTDNSELNWSLVLNAYLDEEINLGKAAEMLGMHEIELKERFVELGIPLRQGSANLAEAQAEVAAICKWIHDDNGK